MADTYGRSERDRGPPGRPRGGYPPGRSGYDSFYPDRRSSVPAIPYDTAPFPPSRPAPPPRSRTMDPRGFLRRESLDPRKRPANRSPEGRPPAKQNKTDQPRDNSIAPGNDSRRSSVSNEGSVWSTKGAQIPDPWNRRPTATVNNESRKETNGVFVDSPDSKASVNGGVASGRSTPQQRANKPVNGATTSSMSAPIGSESFIGSFMTAMAQRATLQIAVDQANERLKRAKEEYQANRPQFSTYDAIKERKTADRDAAQKAYEKKSKELREHIDSLKRLEEALDSHVGNAAATYVSSTDFVSRAELNRVENELNEAKSTAEKLRSEVSEAKSSSNQVPDLLKEITSLMRDVKELQTWKEDNLKSQQEANKKVETSVTESKRVAESTRKEFNTFKNFDVKRLASKQEHNDLETKYEGLEQKVAGVQKTSNQLSKDVAQLKGANMVSSSQPAPAKATLTDGEFKAKLEKVYPQVGTLMTMTQNLQQNFSALDLFTRGQEDEDFDLLPDQQSSLRKRMHFVEQQLGQLKSDLQEEGKDPPVKRLKNLDMIVNKLSSTVSSYDEKGPIVQRVSQLEKDVEALQFDQKKEVNGDQSVLQRLKKLEQNSGAIKYDRAAFQSSPHIQTTSEGPSAVAMLEARVADIDTRQKEFEEQQDSRDELVIKEVEDKDKALQEQIAKVETTRENDSRAFQKSLDDLKDSLAGFYGKLASNTSKEEFEAYQNHIAAEFKRLEAQLITKAVSQTPPPVQADQRPPPDGSPNTPSNGAAAPPPMPNGAFPLRQPNQWQPQPQGPQLHVSQYGNASIQAPANPQQGGNNFQVQIDRVTSIIQHLSRRMDNLQTDDMVRMMSQHIAQIYPHAANFEIAMQTVQSMNTQVDSLKKEVGDSGKQSAAIEHAQMEATIASLNAQRALDSVDNTSKIAGDALRKATETADELDKSKESLAKLDGLLEKVDGYDRAQSAGVKRVEGIEEEIDGLKAAVQVQEEWWSAWKDGKNGK